jgi:hypothetical protein
MQGSLIALNQEEATLQQSLDMIVTHFGPGLAQALIRNIGGDAARSELDFLADTVKKLVTRQTEVRLWVENALLSPTFPSQKVGDAEKKKFVQQIFK